MGEGESQAVEGRGVKRTGLTRRKPLSRKAEIAQDVKAAGKRRRRNAISPASAAQRVKCREALCLMCGASPCDPCHVIDRSITTVGQDHPLATVPACRACHREYDDGAADWLPALQRSYPKELAFAVERVGLMTTLRRVTNQRWAPESEAA